MSAAWGCIMLAYPCNVDSLTPHFYIVKLVVYRGIHYFLIFALKHRSWVHVRTSSIEAVLTCTHDLCFEQNKTIFNQKLSLFIDIKIRTILHRRDIIMHIAINSQ